MSRTRSPAIIKRNDAIFAQWQRGASLTSLAAKHQLSRQAIGKIVASFHPEGEEDEDRAVYRGFMWRLFDEVQELGDRPGWKMRPDGRVAEGPDGEPALDVNVAVQAKELQLKILRELRLLDARDRVQAKQLTVTLDIAQQQMMADIERRRSMVQGEVVRELPPATPEQ